MASLTASSRFEVYEAELYMRFSMADETCVHCGFLSAGLEFFLSKIPFSLALKLPKRLKENLAVFPWVLGLPK